MAKRFTDTRKRRKVWYRKLSPTLKVAWDTLCDECDEAGIWEADFDMLSLLVGAPVSERDVMAAFGDKLLKISDDKIMILGFIPFQYGKLSESCKPHQKVIKRLKNLNLWKGYLERVSDTLKDTLKDTLEEEEEEEEGESEGETVPQHCELSANSDASELTHGDNADFRDCISDPKNGFVSKGISKADIDRCVEEWGVTLRHFKNPKNPILDALEIGRLIRQNGSEKTRAAIAGQRDEPKNSDFDPAKHLSIYRFWKRGIFAANETRGWAVLEREKNQRLAVQKQKSEIAYNDAEISEAPPPDVMAKLSILGFTDAFVCTDFNR